MLSNLTVTLKGRGKVTLRQSNYVTTGGEASIYKVGNDIVKVFTDPNKMIRDRMSDKIGILSRIKHDFVVAPIDLALDQKQNPIGYYMPFADKTEPMSRVFTTAFRQRTNFGDGDAVDLVHNMRETVNIAHNNGCVLVDANELNWLMFKAREAEPRIVDVDSWQVGSQWPASVIMASIQDHHSTVFDDLTDWFSWGVVSFQVFTGIHPYKGRLSGYAPADMEQRMRDNASVFAKGIHLNAAVRDFSCIPVGLLDWYKSVFQDGERSTPPSPRDTKRVAAAARTLRQTISTSGTLIFEKLFENTSDPIVRVYPCGIIMRSTGQIIDLGSKRVLGMLPLTAEAEIVKTNSGWLAGEGDRFFYITLAGVTGLGMGTRIHKVVRSANRLFAVTDQQLAEVKLIDLRTPPILTLAQPGWGVMPQATEWFNGLGVQNALGAKYLILPFGDDKVSFLRAPELDSVTVVTARAGHRFVSVIALNNQGEYKKFEFTLDRNYQSYTLWTGDADTPDLNLAILPNGVCATIVEDGELVIFVPAQNVVRKVPDKTIATDMQLGTWDDKVIFIQNGEVWWVRVK